MASEGWVSVRGPLVHVPSPHHPSSSRTGLGRVLSTLPHPHLRSGSTMVPAGLLPEAPEPPSVDMACEAGRSKEVPRLSSHCKSTSEREETSCTLMRLHAHCWRSPHVSVYVIISGPNVRFTLQSLRKGSFLWNVTPVPSLLWLRARPRLEVLGWCSVSCSKHL